MRGGPLTGDQRAEPNCPAPVGRSFAGALLERGPGMQVPAPFEYERATTVEHAVGLLERLGGAARLVAGGHSLLPMMKLRLANFDHLIDINDLRGELGFIVVEHDRIRIGALTRHRE